MKSSHGNIARRIISAYASLALTVVLVSLISIAVIAYARQKILVEALLPNEVALLSARIRSETLTLTNSIQRYTLEETDNNEAERQSINKQIAKLEDMLQKVTAMVKPEQVDAYLAIGNIRQLLTAFNVQSRKVLDTADKEDGYGLETRQQMETLQDHYQPTLIKALEAFETLEQESASKALKQAEKNSDRIAIILSIVSLLSLAFAVVMSMWLSRRFVVPLTALTDNVRMHPDISMDTPIEIESDDEMGALARALNRMKAEIKETRHKLEQYAETLEAKVEERTLELKLLAITDPLTGVYNRGHFFALAGQILLEAKRMNFPFSVAIIDIDHFKNINDRFGHAVGDYALKQATNTMQSQIRQMDVLGRYGGEEFVIALPAVELAEARQIGERIVTAVSQIQMSQDGEPFGITISCGIASYNYENENLETILLRADKALYAAKQTGRNRVVAEHQINTKGDIMIEYSSAELMIVNAARLLRDGDVVFVGVGQPNLACNLAKRTHAPNLVMIYEAGVIGAEPERLPLSIGDPTLVSGSLSVVSMYDIFSNYLQRGNVDVGFMGGAQIDKFGNINATVIGKYDAPKVRLPGSGGSQEIAAWANRCYIMTPHQKRRFPERCDFRTSVGALDGGGERQQIGLRGRGMEAVVTDIGILEPDENGELMLTALHPGKTVDEAKANTGWDLKVAAQLRTTDSVTERELTILREELDPTGIYLKGGG